MSQVIVSNITTNAGPPLIDTKAVVEQNMAGLYAAKYFVWCWLSQHHSLDQVVSSCSGRLLKERENKNLVKTELTYLLPITPK